MNIPMYEVALFGAVQGAALAMDAFSVSLANGLSEPCMKRRKIFAVASVFAVFQAVMPLIGWVCVSTLASCFESFKRFIPLIAFVLLLFIGGKMLFEGIRGEGEETVCRKLTFATLILQGVATSIDALSVGFTIPEYDITRALAAVLIIAAVTFIICTAGLYIGRKFGTKLAGKAGVLGGVILIAIGVKILVEGIINGTVSF